MKRNVPFCFVLFAAVMLFSACNPILSRDSLNSTSWSLSTIDETPALQGILVTIAFADGQVSGSSGCNSYGGSYKVNGEKITIRSLVSTLMACQDMDIMEQEQTYMQYLQNAQTYQIDSDQLQIATIDGKVLVFTLQK
jgi:heat shock protein HslJ